MKQLIVMVAVVILLLLFPLQYALEQRNYYDIGQFQKYVYNAKEAARVKGYFTDNIIDELKTDLLTEFGEIEESEIIIEVTRTPKYRTNAFDEREMIYYKIGIPLKKLIAANALLGISDEENSTYYFIESYAPSELVLP